MLKIFGRDRLLISLVMLLAVSLTGCLGPEPAASPTATRTVGVGKPTAEATNTAQPTAAVAPTDIVEPEASPTSAAGATPPPTVDVSGLEWTPVGLSGRNIDNFALLPGGENLVLAAGRLGVWRSSYDYTKWEATKVRLSGEGQVSTVSIGSADVMYATNHTGCASGLPIVAFYTNDGDKTWQQVSVDTIDIVAADSSTAYGITCMGVVKTTDSGATWDELPGSSVTNYDPRAIAASPDGQLVYVVYVSEGGTGQVQQSTDGGETWTNITPKAGADSELFAPGDLFFVTGSVGRPDDGGLYMTSDQGLWFLPLETTEWRLMKKDPSQDAPPDPAEDYRITALYVDTAYSEEYDKPGPIIYTARAKIADQGQEQGLGVFRSTDGMTWESVGTGIEGRVVNALLLAPHDPAANPSMVETLLAGTDQGVWALPMLFTR